MRRFLSYVWRNKRTIVIILILIVIGAFFRWEVREVNDAKTGELLVHHRGIVFPWKACGMSPDGDRLVDFHVRHWLCYGLVKVEATGQTVYGSLR